jgi:hypothetical protein
MAIKPVRVATMIAADYTAKINARKRSRQGAEARASSAHDVQNELREPVAAFSCDSMPS